MSKSVACFLTSDIKKVKMIAKRGSAPALHVSHSPNVILSVPKLSNTGTVDCKTST